MLGAITHIRQIANSSCAVFDCISFSHSVAHESLPVGTSLTIFFSVHCYLTFRLHLVHSAAETFGSTICKTRQQLISLPVLLALHHDLSPDLIAAEQNGVRRLVLRRRVR